jgi:hypothetical protein
MTILDRAMIAVCGVLLLVLFSRERFGFGRIRFETALVLTLYGLAVPVMF